MAEPRTNIEVETDNMVLVKRAICEGAEASKKMGQRLFCGNDDEDSEEE